jgi:hypothetical protein
MPWLSLVGVSAARFDSGTGGERSCGDGADGEGEDRAGGEEGGGGEDDLLDTF